MSRAARIGIFGGTFNPIHLGHLRAAEEVLEALALERMLFVPSGEPPHKSASAQDPIAPAAQRLAWVRAAVADNPHFSVEALEIERTGTSYSIETLRTLGARIAPDLPVFVIGIDAFAEIGTWREPEALFTLANFAVITRPGQPVRATSHWLPERVKGEFELAADGGSARHRRAGTWLKRLEIAPRRARPARARLGLGHPRTAALRSLRAVSVA